MVHEVGNKNLSKTVLDFFCSYVSTLPRLFEKNLFCGPYRQLRTDVAPVISLDLFETIA